MDKSCERQGREAFEAGPCDRVGPMGGQCIGRGGTVPAGTTAPEGTTAPVATAATTGTGLTAIGTVTALASVLVCIWERPTASMDRRIRMPDRTHTPIRTRMPLLRYGYPAGAPFGGVRLEVLPRHAEVFVDGYYAGNVDDFDGSFQRLELEEGAHNIEIRAPGFQPATFDVNVAGRSDHQVSR